MQMRSLIDYKLGFKHNSIFLHCEYNIKYLFIFLQNEI